VQERRPVAALTRFGVLAFAIAVIVVVADRATTSLALDHLHDVRHVWGPFGLTMAVGSGLVLGGAVGNLSERIVGGPGGRVPDFITLNDWPTFNLADACVTVGVIIIIAALLFGDRSPARPKVEEAG
jgi:lipoprotein signal peptidase